MAIYQWIRKRMGANLDNRSWHHIKFNVFNEKIFSISSIYLTSDNSGHFMLFNLESSSGGV
jgi:Ni,Fe-hydrogenase I cytochrome b subunit